MFRVIHNHFFFILYLLFYMFTTKESVVINLFVLYNMFRTVHKINQFYKNSEQKKIIFYLLRKSKNDKHMVDRRTKDCSVVEENITLHSRKSFVQRLFKDRHHSWMQTKWVDFIQGELYTNQISIYKRGRPTRSFSSLRLFL